ncbi:MAG: asparaginase [Minwuia sp.]|nr:asparaginase [Minwuia sp.]
MPADQPIEIVTTRGGLVESVHRVHAVVAGPDGIATHVFGEQDRMIFPRSAIKALQALPLVESGAAAAHGLSSAELALSCASHEGERFHTAAVTTWLDRIGLTEAALACGPQWPRRLSDQNDLVRAAEEPVRRHNNCSGKHSGMLTTALHLGDALHGYQDRRHPVQQRIFAAMGDMAGVDLGNAPFGIDGCSAPNPSLPLLAVATAAARVAEAGTDRLGTVRADACRTLRQAMIAHPEMIGGTDRVDTDMIRASDGRILSKTGAEGVYVAYLPEQHMGLALKTEDGASRAAAAALWSVLETLGLLDGAIRSAMTEHCRPPIRNWDGQVTGQIVDVREY